MTKIFTDAEMEQLFEKIVNASGPGGIHEDEAQKAYEQFHQMAMLAEFVKLWRDGYMSIGWDTDKEEITWGMTEQGREKAASR